MKNITLLITKIIILLSRKKSNIPAKIALKVFPKILGVFKLPKKTIFITGTNGKTTVAKILKDVYEKNNFKVAHNIGETSAPLSALTCLIANSTLSGKVKSDVLIVKLNIKSVHEILKYITPNYLVVTNVAREKAMTYDFFEAISKNLKKTISNETHLILNADDPFVYSLNNGNSSYFGIKADGDVNFNYDDNLDVVFCPICQTKLTYTSNHYNNIGDYYCESESFKRPTPEFETELVNNNYKIDNLEARANSIYNVYNASAAYIVLKATNTDPNEIKNFKFEAFEKYQNEKTFYIPYSKIKTPLSFQHILELISQEKTPATVIIGFKKPPNSDTSWLWDVNFELLNTDNVKEIICVGAYANDIAVRLNYAADSDKITVVEKDVMKYINENGTKNCYFLTCDYYHKKVKKEAQVIL